MEKIFKYIRLWRYALLWYTFVTPSGRAYTASGEGLPRYQDFFNADIDFVSNLY